MRDLSLGVVIDDSQAHAALARVESDIRQVGTTTDDADAKLTAFKKRLADQREYKASQDALKQTASDARDASKANDELAAAVMRYAGPAVVIAAAKKTLDFADRVQNLSDNVKVSAVTIQQWGHVGEKAGASMEQVASAVQRLGANLVRDTKPVQEAMRGLGLDTQKLLAMDPEKRFRAFAEAIAKVEDPALQAYYAQTLLNQSGRELIKTMEDIAAGADTHAPAMSNAWVKANAEVKSSLDDVLASARDLGMWFIGWAPVLVQKAGEIGDAWQRALLQRVYGVAGGVPPPALPGAPSGGIPLPTPAGPLPLPTRADGTPATTIPFIPSTAGGRASQTAARVLPFVRPVPDGVTAASIFAMANTPGSFLAGSLPFMSSPGALADATFQQFAGVGFAPTVAQNAPGSPSLLGRLFGGGRGSALAGAGLGLLSNLIPGLSRTGSSIGAMAGSFLGPLGSGLGSLAGGLIGKLFGGGNQDKKQINTAKSSADFKQLQADAERLGISLDRVFAAKKVKDFEAAVKSVSQQISDQEAKADRVKSAMERWGLTVEDMGQKFKQAEMNTTALGFAQDFVDLADAGADTTKILEKMAPTLSEFIAKSKQMGTEVPREMRPVLEAAQKAGLLFDENGEKLTDETFGAITWAQTMTQGFDKVEAAINRLTDAILGVGEAFDKAGQSAERFGDTVENTTMPTGDPSLGFASGGVAGRDFRRPGHGDVFPALLRRGERVLPPGVSGGGVTLSIGALTVGGGYGSRSAAVEEIGEAIVAYAERRGARLVA